MTLHPRLTPATLALVKRFETFQPVAERTPSGGWSVGYGHTLSAREGARVTPADAEALLIYDLDRAARTVEHALFAAVTEGQFEALTALCFNLGDAAFLRSTALARVNAGAELDAADEIERWRQAELGAGTQVVDALVRRRAAEKAHFLALPEGASTWPSGQRRPLSVPGGETAEPAAAVDCPASAALTAANDVQARLRRLIPDDETATAPPSAAPAPANEVDIPADDPAEPELIVPPEAAAAPDALDSGVAWEPTAPPFDPPAPLSIVPDVPPAPVLRPGPVAAPADEPAARAERSDADPTRRRDPRRVYAVLGLLGVVLFGTGVAMILGGRPGLFNLGIGIVGVLVAVPSLYGLLGAPTPPHAPHADVSPPQPAPATAKPFHPGPVDTK